MIISIGDKVSGLSRKMTSEIDVFDKDNNIIPGMTREKATKDMKIVPRKIEQTITGVVKAIDPDMYFGVEVTKENGEPEYFHRSSLTVISKPF